MDKSKMTEYIKVNFPLTAEDFAAGNGEGMFVLVDKKTKEAYDKDVSGGEWVGILDNDSVYFPGLNHGEVVRFEMRGEKRPVAFFDGFLSERKRLTPEQKAAVMAAQFGPPQEASSVESLSQLIAANKEKQKAAETKRAELKKKIDLNILAAEGLEKRAAKKRKTARELYNKLGKLDYGNWVSDVLWPLADELARRTGKKASIIVRSGIGTTITVALTDEERDPEWYMKERLELNLEASFNDDGLVLSYEAGDASDRYAPGTAGCVNSLNNINAPLPDSVEEILGLLRAHPAIANSDEGGKEDG